MIRDHYSPGDWNATCSMCGRKRKASTLVRNWQGMYRCPEHNEARHPQDYVRVPTENPGVPWSQPQTDLDIQICTINGRSAVPAYSLPGCMMPGNSIVDLTAPAPDPVDCDVYEVQGVPGWAGPGCAIPGFDPMAA